MKSQTRQTLMYWRSGLSQGNTLPINSAQECSGSEQVPLQFLNSLKIPEEQTKAIHQAWLEMNQKDPKLSSLHDSVPVIIYPLSFKGRVVDGRHQSFQKRLLPLAIPLALDRNGDLQRRHTSELEKPEDIPWIDRQLLSPVDFEVAEDEQTLCQPIASLDDFDEFRTKHPFDFRNSAEQVMEYAREMFLTVSGSDPTEFVIAGMEREECALVCLDRREDKNTLTHVFRLLDWLNRFPQLNTPLLDRYASLDEPPQIDLPSTDRTEKGAELYLGHTGERFSLSHSQRKAVYEVLTQLEKKPVENIFAVNGPPGTGKTDLLKNLLASLWVKRVCEEGEVPLLVFTSVNNQAVTNVIENFTTSLSSQNIHPADQVWMQRWLPDLQGFGLYCCSGWKVQDSPNYPFYTTEGNSTAGSYFQKLENEEYLARAKTYFFTKLDEHFQNRETTINAEVALRILQNSVLSGVRVLEAVLHTAKNAENDFERAISHSADKFNSACQNALEAHESLEKVKIDLEEEKSLQERLLSIETLRTDLHTLIAELNKNEQELILETMSQSKNLQTRASIEDELIEAQRMRDRLESHQEQLQSLASRLETVEPSGWRSFWGLPAKMTPYLEEYRSILNELTYVYQGNVLTFDSHLSDAMSAEDIIKHISKVLSASFQREIPFYKRTEQIKKECLTKILDSMKNQQEKIENIERKLAQIRSRKREVESDIKKSSDNDQRIKTLLSLHRTLSEAKRESDEHLNQVSAKHAKLTDPHSLRQWVNLWAEKKLFVLLKNNPEVFRANSLDQLKKLCTEFTNFQDLYSQIDEFLDTQLRLKLFWLATHYWELRWIFDVEPQLEKQKSQGERPGQKSIWYQGFPKVSELKRSWLAMAKLTPALVSTTLMLPRFFQGKRVWQHQENKLSGYEWLANTIDLLIFDESGQVPPALGAVGSVLAKNILAVGDAWQLGPVSQVQKFVDGGNWSSKVDHVSYRRATDLGYSNVSGSCLAVAQRLSPWRTGRQGGVTLLEHYRCLPEIIAYSNELCYEGLLQPQRTLPHCGPYPLPHFGFLAVEGVAKREGQSRVNQAEVNAIVHWISYEFPKFVQKWPPYQKLWNEHKGISSLCKLLAIVTPFRPQAEKIRKGLLMALGEAAKDIVVGTVHRLQGAQCPVVLFSPVYSEEEVKAESALRFFASPNLLNVAVSRAQDAFLCFGHPALLSASKHHYAALSLLSKYLTLKPENNLALYLSNLRPNESSDNLLFIRDLEGHRLGLRNALLKARQKITIVSPFLSSYAIESDNLIPLFKDCIARGVKVSVYFDPQLNKEGSNLYKRSFTNALVQLDSAGVDLYPCLAIHNKTVSVDQSELLLGSFNWLSARRNSADEYARLETSLHIQGPEAAPMIKTLEFEMRETHEMFEKQNGSDFIAKVLKKIPLPRPAESLSFQSGSLSKDTSRLY